MVSRLPLPNYVFDLVTAVETHYYWPDCPGDMRKIYRVLKLGGSVLIIAEEQTHDCAAFVRAGSAQAFPPGTLRTSLPKNQPAPPCLWLPAGWRTLPHPLVSRSPPGFSSRAGSYSGACIGAEYIPFVLASLGITALCGCVGEVVLVFFPAELPSRTAL
jgi:SAM-dependent methyltransferase